ncbi:MAG TPA: hypothetical protein VFP44_22250 [Usitatibacter sp.]|nr:hypothetical protein [Usitatibacter sp.]
MNTAPARPGDAPRGRTPGTHPTLELSGPKLAIAFESLALAAEEAGGIERYVDALKLKSAFFAETLGEGRARDMGFADLRAVCAWMSTVRRRIGAYIEPEGFPALRERIARLLEGPAAETDARIESFCAAFPDDRAHRWVRDLAAELLHHTDPERYPLMTRWVWDERANTGVLREIWHGEQVDNMTIDVPARYDTFIALREELAQFLAGQGVYRDVMQYVDLLAANVYARYIHEQGGSYLRADFSNAEAPMTHVHRLLGLDGIAGDGRTRLKAADGTAVVIEELHPAPLPQERRTG